MLKIIKFGGSFIRDLETMRASARIILEEYRQGHNIVVVVSAMQGETNRLLSSLRQSSPGYSHKEGDVALSTGEALCAALFSILLQERGLKARSFLSWQVPLLSDSTHGNADLLCVKTNALKEALSKGYIPVVAGFQAVTSGGLLTTLGRGGSDITAVALAQALKGVCLFYKDVGAIHTADPHLVRKAQPLAHLNYDQALLMTKLGSPIIATKALMLAKNYSLPLSFHVPLNHVTQTLITDSAPQTPFMLLTPPLKTQTLLPAFVITQKYISRAQLTQYLRQAHIPVFLAHESMHEENIILSFLVPYNSKRETLNILHSALATKTQDVHNPYV